MRRATWWIGVLFAVGSVCFLVGPFPGFVELVGSRIDGIVFFVGSIFFTSAATLQYVEGGLYRPGGLDWWSNVIQLAGTLFFNVTTFNALQTGLDANEYNRLVWTPDWRGSICFLVSGALAYAVVHRARWTRDWWIAFVNLLGCVAFGISALGAFVLPSSGDPVAVTVANAGTAIGALAFLVGSVLLLPEGGSAGSAPDRDLENESS